jgi:hypothetical protein
VDVRAAFVAQREAAEAMQPGQGAFDNPAEDAEAAAMRTAGLGGPWKLPGAVDAENAPTALSSGDDFKNGQKTPCLRSARTYAILTAPAAGWFSNVR